jgi:MoaA/NifB/PqqE/SkfB family radical SAM enzyme
MEVTVLIPVRNLKRSLAKAARQPGYALKVAIKRLTAQAYYCLGNGRSSLPEAITLFLTHRCNLRCKMCGQWGESGVTKNMDTATVRGELGLGELKRFVKEIRYFRPNVTLFGGEPLLYAGCPELVREI